jgi:hypothetical protein
MNIRVARALLLATLVAALGSACVSQPSSPDSTTPTATPTPTSSTTVGPTTDEEELDALWTMYVERQFPDETRPDVQLIRYTSPRELAALKVECLNSAGFPDVTLTPDNAIAYGPVPPEQELAFGLASYTCAAQYLVDPIYRVPLSAEQLGELYDYYLSGLIPCLADRGYPTTDVPSKGTFVANYASEGWNPYQQSAPLMAQDEWTRVNQECPQWPSGFYGF